MGDVLLYVGYLRVDIAEEDDLSYEVAWGLAVLLTERRRPPTFTDTRAGQVVQRMNTTVCVRAGAWWAKTSDMSG